MNRKRLTNDSQGFTMVELLIVLPIVSLIVIIVFNYMFVSYGKMLQENTEANLRLEGETMLLDLQDELLFTTDYGEVRSADLTDAYAPVGGWTYNTNPDTLIIYETSLTAPRRDPNREFVYKNVYGCSGANSAFNPIAINNLIYFTKQNTVNQYKTLYRRTLTPQYSLCGTNYKLQTCPVANVGTPPCMRADTILSSNIIDFRVDYFDENNVMLTTPPSSPFSAEKVKLTAILGQSMYGKNLSVETTITMKKIN